MRFSNQSKPLPGSGVGQQGPVGSAVGVGVGVGSGVLVGIGVSVGAGVEVSVGVGVGVSVGVGVPVEVGVAVGVGLGEGDGIDVTVGVGVTVGAWAVMVDMTDRAIAVVVAWTLGVGVGVGPQAAVRVTMIARTRNFFMILSSLASTIIAHRAWVFNSLTGLPWRSGYVTLLTKYNSCGTMNNEENQRIVDPAPGRPAAES